MNRITEQYFPVFEYYQSMRFQLLEILTDEDLTFRPTAANPTLGSLCREIGEVEQSYIRSFRTLKLEFTEPVHDPALESSVARLSEWLSALDRELRKTIEALSDEEIRERQIDRGSFSLPPRIQLEVYKEALVIFYGKVSVYLKAVGKPLPEQWRQAIG